MRRDQSAGGHPRRVERLLVGPGQRALRREQQNGVARHAGLHQVEQAFDRGAGLSTPGRTLQEDFGIQGRLDQGDLGGRKRKRLH
jgi:hypothetical protein